MAIFAISGASRATTDGAIGTSGSPIRVYAAAMNPTGTVAGAFVLRNGTSASADAWVTQSNDAGDGTAAGRVVFFGDQGILFSSGCFYDHGTSNSSVTIQYSVEA